MNIADNSFRGRVAALSNEDFELLRSAVDARACRDAVGFATLDEAADVSSSPKW